MPKLLTLTRTLTMKTLPAGRNFTNHGPKTGWSYSASTQAGRQKQAEDKHRCQTDPET